MADSKPVKANSDTATLLYLVPGIFFMVFAIPIVGLYLLFKKSESNKILKFVLTVIGAIFGTMVYTQLM